MESREGRGVKQPEELSGVTGNLKGTADDPVVEEGNPGVDTGIRAVTRGDPP